MERVSQPGFRRHEKAHEVAGRLRRPQSLRPGVDARFRDRVLFSGQTAVIGREAIKKARLLVVGDVMLDRYWFGDVSRISPEAPVPVVRVGRTEERLGGAANVARNIVAIGAAAGLLSVVGEDEAAGCIRTLL